jgi:hypothetical protein
VGAAAPTRAADLCGCWEGRWYGCTDGLQGTVKAKITKCGPGRYEAIFTGRAFKVMPYRYKSTLIAWTDADSGRMYFKVTQKLPIWGCYWMNGYVTDCQFFARYHTDDHVGYFKMTRVSCK